jgi:uncharacterized protein YjbJ (UPF0337 family)
MNSDQFKGSLREIAGKAQEWLGKLTSNPLQQDRGVDLLYRGRAQVHRGDLKEFAETKLHDIDFPKRRNGWNNGRG